MSFPNSSLQHAVNSGDLTAIRTILAAGADANAANESGQTPIIVAIVKGHYQVVDLLLSFGADPLLRDSTGLNAIEWAQRKGRMELVQLLGKPSPAATKSSQKVTPQREKKPPPTPRVDGEEQRSEISEAEKSRRFIAGLRQRLEEKASRDINASPQADATEQLTNERLEIRPATPQIPNTDAAIQPPSPKEEETTPGISTRKRCPKCDRIYDSELLAYCAYHEVQLVDADTRKEALTALDEAPPKPMPILWILVAAALAIGSFAGFLLINSLFIKQPDDPPARAAPTPFPNQKGLPVLSTQLDGKTESLPEAEVPPNTVDEPTTVTVRVRIDRLGRIYSASSTAEDEILRNAAIEAAKKATFSVEKLRGRSASGTITYTFR